MQFSLSACLDHTTLRALFDGLRKCASSNSRWISSVIPHLANLYDNLLLRDLSQSEISVSICELLFFTEDLVDHGDCKISFKNYPSETATFSSELVSPRDAVVISVKPHTFVRTFSLFRQDYGRTTLSWTPAHISRIEINWNQASTSCC